MELYKVKIPLDNIDTITGSTVVSGQTIPTGYVKLTKTGDTYVSLFLTSNYDDMGVYTDFDIIDILEFNTTIPTGNTLNTVPYTPTYFDYTICSGGTLAFSTHISTNYTGSTAYVKPFTGCTQWTVTGSTSNNMLEILPIAGITGLTTNSHARYDANENPIEVTLLYGNPTVGAKYDIGTGNTTISYNTTDISNLDTTFDFKRECVEECYAPNTKEDLKMGWVFDPKMDINVFIDRGQNSVFDRFLRLSEVSNNDELLDYNNNYFNVNKQNII